MKSRQLRQNLRLQHLHRLSRHLLHSLQNLLRLHSPQRRLPPNRHRQQLLRSLLLPRILLCSILQVFSMRRALRFLLNRLLRSPLQLCSLLLPHRRSLLQQQLQLNLLPSLRSNNI